jgi:hypothetical protein
MKEFLFILIFILIDTGITTNGSEDVNVLHSSTHPILFSLTQNYPNPFNPSTTFSFSLPSKSFVSLKIYDMQGRKVAILVSEEMSAGTYSRQWNAANISSGVYFYQLQVGSFLQTKKMVLVK